MTEVFLALLQSRKLWEGTLQGRLAEAGVQEERPPGRSRDHKMLPLPGTEPGGKQGGARKVSLPSLSSPVLCCLAITSHWPNPIKTGSEDVLIIVHKSGLLGQKVD